MFVDVDKITYKYMHMRLAKFIANSGYCSRREAEILIAEGRVKVDGSQIHTAVTFVDKNQHVTVDEKDLSSESRTRLWLYYKPQNTITTHHDPQKRVTVFSLLPKNLPRVISVGRLDYSTEGLLLLTNNGALAHKFALPATALERKYMCRIFGDLRAEHINKIANGITIDGISYGKIKITYNNTSKKLNFWVTISLTEGKNREIRKVLAYFGVQVSRLIRVSYGEFMLNGMKPGDIKEVQEQVISRLLPYNNI
ncbi:Uncharacterized RNA pseudouridine synthase RT0532 [Alphaproteobacteria bacterium]